MIEAAVEMDDDAMEAYLMDAAEPDVPTLRKLLRKGTLAMANSSPFWAARRSRTRASSHF